MPVKTRITAGNREVLDRLFNAVWREGLAVSRRTTTCEECGLPVAVAELPDGSLWTAHVERFRALDRIRTRPPYRIDEREIGGPEELPPLPGEWTTLRDEAMQGAANLDLFLEAAPARAPRQGGMLDLSAEELESWNLRGHELHPGCKTRFGFSPEEVRRYSPELGARFDLRFVALRREHAVETGAAPLPWEHELRQELPDPDYLFLAVHPWQWEHVIQSRFAPEIESGILKPLRQTHPATPLASLRTLVPHKPGYQVKLPIAVQSTSAMRTVSPQSAQNGPRLTALLDEVLSGPVTLQGEDRGVHLRTDDLEKAKHLSMILRRPVTDAVPVAVLSELSPLTGRPIVTEAAQDDPLGWFAHYARVAADSFIPVLFQYGIAIEAHAQNCLIRLEDRKPTRMIVRDLGGIRVYRPWLRRELDLHPASVIVAETPEELIAKSHHCFVQGHLAPLISALAEAYDLEEAPFWRLAKMAIGDERYTNFDKLTIKALTVMRLGKRSHQYDFCQVENPLR